MADLGLPIFDWLPSLRSPLAIGNRQCEKPCRDKASQLLLYCRPLTGHRVDVNLRGNFRRKSKYH